MRVAEAYPYGGTPRDPARWAQVNYLGPLSMYLNAGSEKVRELGDGYVPMRKELA